MDSFKTIFYTGEPKCSQTKNFTFDKNVPPKTIDGQDDFTTRASKRMAYDDCISNQSSLSKEIDQKHSPPRKKDG